MQQLGLRHKKSFVYHHLCPVLSPLKPTIVGDSPSWVSYRKGLVDSFLSIFVILRIVTLQTALYSSQCLPLALKASRFLACPKIATLYLGPLISGFLSCRITYCMYIGIFLDLLMSHSGYLARGSDANSVRWQVVHLQLGQFVFFPVLLNMANWLKSQILSSFWTLASLIQPLFFLCRYILLNVHI